MSANYVKTDGVKEEPMIHCQSHGSGAAGAPRGAAAAAAAAESGARMPFLSAPASDNNNNESSSGNNNGLLGDASDSRSQRSSHKLPLGGITRLTLAQWRHRRREAEEEGGRRRCL